MVNQVLVVYNASAAEAAGLKDSYLDVHRDIPADNVLQLNSASLITDDLTRADFVSYVRDPIRGYLLQPDTPAPEDTVAIVLIRPFPHRVLDTDNALIGRRER